LTENFSKPLWLRVHITLLFFLLRFVDGLLGRHTSDKLSEWRGPLGGAVEWRGWRRAMTATSRGHLVRVGRRGGRWRDSRIRRELTAASASGAFGWSASDVTADVFIIAGRRERIVDVRYEPGQRSTGNRSFGGRRRRVRERARRQAFGELCALQFDVRRGHPIGGTTKLVERETTSDESRSLLSAGFDRQ